MLWQCSTFLIKEHSKLTNCRLQCRSICRCASSAVNPFGWTTLVHQIEDWILLWHCSTFLLKEHSKLCRLNTTVIPVNLQMHFHSCWPFWQNNSCTTKERFNFAPTLFHFPVKRALKIVQTEYHCNTGQFADALPQLLTFLEGQVWLIKIKI